jgi:indole-3-glycerol phosphate synthase
MTPAAAGGVLAAIVAGRRRSVELARRARPRSAVERAITRRPDGAAFRAALEAPGIRVVAECKRRSPSKGILRKVYDPAAIAAAYRAGGACAISVLTEPSFFDGALDHLRDVRRSVDLPLLRKDFIVDEYQLVEAAEAGADAVLLIAAALADGDLAALLAAARSMGLAALVEVHRPQELDRALANGADLIGVNSRDLRTLSVNASDLREMIERVPPAALAVAESGLRTPADLAGLCTLGYRAFLIGEHLITQADPGAALAELRIETAHLVGTRR